MEGEDVKQWQLTLNRQLRTWDVDYQLNPDGDYGSLTQSLTASVCHGLGLASASQAMAHGVTPELRVKLRDKDLTPKELKRYHGKRAKWRDEFRRKHENKDVSTPLAKILQSEWGWTPPGHDGVDLDLQRSTRAAAGHLQGQGDARATPVAGGGPRGGAERRPPRR